MKTENDRILENLYNAHCNHAHVLAMENDLRHNDHRQRLSDAAERLRTAMNFALQAGERTAKHE